jgi:hypothetical protein
MVFLPNTIQIYTHQIRIQYVLIYIVFALHLPKSSRHFCALSINDPKSMLEKLLLTKKVFHFITKQLKRHLQNLSVVYCRK